MTLIKSISGIRGTIGGQAGEGLSPVDIVKFTSAFVAFIQKERNKQNLTFVVGRDGRISGEMVNNIVTGTLMGMGVNVIDGGLSTTPTIEMALTQLANLAWYLESHWSTDALFGLLRGLGTHAYTDPLLKEALGLDEEAFLASWQAAAARTDEHWHKRRGLL